MDKCKCGYEFIVFPDGEREADLAEYVCALESKPLQCIDCLEGEMSHVLLPNL